MRISLLAIIIFALFCFSRMQAQIPVGSTERQSAPDSVAVIVTAQQDTQDAPGVRGDSVFVPTGGERERVDYWRVAAVSAAAVSTLGATYIYLNDTWWKGEEHAPFHFDSGADWYYANNLDKAAHFYCGHIAAELFYGGMRWARLEEKTAAWTAAGLGAFVQIAIELKDGYSPRWGFGLGDVTAGTLGSLMFVGRHYSPVVDAIDVKFSYWRNSEKYFKIIKPTGTWNDDYINQTYWASVNVDELLPASAAAYWPDWLALAVGVGVDDRLEGVYEDRPLTRTGNIELYLALDVDITKILPSDNEIWEATKRVLNYIKFPAPAIRITPSVVWYGLYF